MDALGGRAVVAVDYERHLNQLDTRLLSRNELREFFGFFELYFEEMARTAGVLHELREVIRTNISSDSVLTSELEQACSSSLPDDVPEAAL